MGQVAQFGNDETGVVTGTAHDGVNRVTKCALEWVSGQASVHLRVPNDWLNGAAVPDHGLECTGDAAPLTRPEQAHAVALDTAWASAALTARRVETYTPQFHHRRGGWVQRGLSDAAHCRAYGQFHPGVG